MERCGRLAGEGGGLSYLSFSREWKTRLICLGHIGGEWTTRFPGGGDRGMREHGAATIG